MNELEEKLSAWRARMSAALSNREDTVRELESHLRDHYDALLRRGVAPDEAWAESVRRLGEAHGLAREFRRVQSPWWPASWSLRGVLALFAGANGFVIALIGSKLVAGKIAALLAVHVVLITAGYFCVFATGLVGACAMLTAWRRPRRAADLREVRALTFRLSVASCVLLPVAIGLGALWSMDALGSAWSWSRVEIGAFCVSISSCLMLIVQMRAVGSDSLRWSLALLSSLVVVAGFGMARALTYAAPLAWVGAALVMAQGGAVMVQLFGVRAVRE